MPVLWLTRRFSRVICPRQSFCGRPDLALSPTWLDVSFFYDAVDGLAIGPCGDTDSDPVGVGDRLNEVFGIGVEAYREEFFGV